MISGGPARCPSSRTIRNRKGHPGRVGTSSSTCSRPPLPGDTAWRMPLPHPRRRNDRAGGIPLEVIMVFQTGSRSDELLPRTTAAFRARSWHPQHAGALTAAVMALSVEDRGAGRGLVTLIARHKASERSAGFERLHADRHGRLLRTLTHAFARLRV